MAKKYCTNHPLNKVWSKGLCIDCYRKLYAKPLKKTPINPISTKQKNMLCVYRMLSRKYIREHPVCELNLTGCLIVSSEVHHSGKKYSQELWLDVTKFIACCRPCHEKAENPKIAKQLGIYNYKISDDKKNNDSLPLLDAESDFNINREDYDKRDAVY